MTATTTIAQGSRKQILFVPETTFATTPATPAMKFLRFTGENFELVRGKNQSGEVRPDRQIQDLRLGQRSVNADFDLEWSYGSYDDFLEALLGGTWTSEAAGTPNTLIMGNIQRSFSMEVGHPDINQYRLYKGMVVDKMSMAIKDGGAIITGKCNLLGADMVLGQTSQDADPTVVSTASPMDSSAAMTMKEGGSSIAIVTALDFTVSNNLKGDSNVGSTALTGIGYGKAVVEGTLTAHFKDQALLTKFLNETETSLQMVLAGLPVNKTLTIDIPRVKYTGSKVDAAVEGSLGIALPFQGLFHVITGSTIKYTRSNPAA